MANEYWLQKRTLGGWSIVTWYEDEKQAKENYDRACESGKGYSWRLVAVNVVCELRLEEEKEIEAPDAADAFAATWAKPSPALNSGWGATATADWGNDIKTLNPSPNAGVSVRPPRLDLHGSVWLMHHGLKKRTRVAADLVEGLLKEGYERGGPQTAFRI